VKRLLPTLLFALNLPGLFVLSTASASAGGAEESKAPVATKAPAKLTAHKELPASPTRSGVAAHFGAEAVRLWTTCAVCAPDAEGALAVEIPFEARSLRRRVDVVGTKDHPVLWARWGSDDHFYSMVVMGAPSPDAVERKGAADGKEAAEGKPAPTPQLVLKGWAGENSPQKTLLKKGQDGDLTLELAREASFCGRSAPRETRVLRPFEGRFVTVRGPVLTPKERESAERKEALPWTDSENLLVALEAAGTRSSRVPVDAEGAAAWSGSFEFTELVAPPGVDAGTWVFEFAAPLKGPTALYFVVSEKVYQVEFLPSSSQRYGVQLGGNEGDCVALVQPRTPAPLVEIMGTAKEKGAQTTAELVAELKGKEPSVVDALLALRGAPAGRELARAYGKLSPEAQGRAFAIARRLSPEAGSPVYVRALEAGDAQSEEALSRLIALGPLGAAALFARLKEGSRGDETALIAALSSLDPAFAARHLPLLLEEKQGERRAQLRDALGRLVKDERARAAFSKWLREEEMQRLSPAAQLELVRALAPEISRLEGAYSALARLAEGADFEAAYHLVPLLVKYQQKVERGPEILSRWLSGKVSREAGEEEKAALSVRVLESLLEHGEHGAKETLGDSWDEVLTSENMRVRRGALLNLARHEEASRAREAQLLKLLTDDRWPQVRAAAALSVFPEANGSFTPRAERVLLRRLKNDPDGSVRRALLRAVAAAQGEEIVSAARRAFEKDEDYLVRAEAAVTLGKLCDKGSIGALTARARALGSGLMEEGPIELGLSSVTALALLTPSDINKRLAPLLSEKAPGLTRKQVLLRIEAAKAISGRAPCGR
jgi:hypothetical protein